MKKSEVAKLMYGLQEYCRYVWDDSDDIGCPKCVANKGGVCDLFIPCYGVPHMWGITQADIERLRKQEIEAFICKGNCIGL